MGKKKKKEEKAPVYQSPIAGVAPGQVATPQQVSAATGIPVGKTVEEQRRAFDLTQQQVQAEQANYSQNYNAQLATMQGQYNNQIGLLSQQTGTQQNQYNQQYAQYQQQLTAAQADRESTAGLLSQQLSQQQTAYQQQMDNYRQQVEAQRAETQGILSGLQTQLGTQQQQYQLTVQQMQDQYNQTLAANEAQRVQYQQLYDEQAAAAKNQQDLATKSQLELEQRLGANTTKQNTAMNQNAQRQSYNRVVTSQRGAAQLPTDYLRGGTQQTLLRR